MADMAHDWTDEQIAALAKKMNAVYQQASDEMAKKLKDWLADYDAKNQRWIEDVRAGVATKADYEEWKRRRAFDRTWYQNMISTLSNDAVECDVRCRQMINDEIPTVAAECANIEAYELDRAIGLDTGFTLYNQDSIRFLLTDPRIYPQVDVPADLAWNAQKFSSAITQSILQGESIPNAAKRLDSVFGMGKTASVRAARTAMTYAENKGKLTSMERLERMGVPLKKEWHARHDGRTRLEHRQADKQAVPVRDKFVVGGEKMEEPGDPSASGWNVYNCRCYISRDLDFDDIPERVLIENDKLPKDVTYDEWKAGKFVTDKHGRETKKSKRDRGVK